MMEIKYVPLDSLILDPRNPRLHSPKQITQIGRSINTFGFIVPAIVDATSHVLAGHGRIAGARLAGLTAIPVVRVEHLTPAQMRAFKIADNRLAENADWDKPLLAEQFKILAEAEIDFSLEITGFVALA